MKIENTEFKDKIFVITGGTGSFGGAVLRRLLNLDVKEIRIFSRDEKKQDDMRHRYQSSKLKFYIGDVRNPRSLEDAMAGAHYVFHAAALKQVPSCEFYPMEAVRTNIEGTDNTLRVAEAAGVERVVVLSTDKAAYPINAMGISKAMMEKVAVSRSRVGTQNGGCVVTCTRYGNVMASRGSVIPLFLDQIKQGKPLTVTDPGMTRFMMTLESAVDLVLFAFQQGKAGDLFVQKAPASTVGVLAESLQQLLNVNQPISVIGTRHGEKLFETLLTREEMANAEDLGDYYRVPADGRDLNYGLFFSEGDTALADLEDYHSHNTKRLAHADVKKLLLQLPEVRAAMEHQSA